jgi:hypothetical protein
VAKTFNSGFRISFGSIDTNQYFVLSATQVMYVPQNENFVHMFLQLGVSVVFYLRRRDGRNASAQS